MCMCSLVSILTIPISCRRLLLTPPGNDVGKKKKTCEYQWAANTFRRSIDPKNVTFLPNKSASEATLRLAPLWTTPFFPSYRLFPSPWNPPLAPPSPHHHDPPKILPEHKSCQIRHIFLFVFFISVAREFVHRLHKSNFLFWKTITLFFFRSLSFKN